MENVVFTFALVFTTIFAYRYWAKIFSVKTLVIVLFGKVTLNLFDWL
jgi:hypothetical protein